MNKKDQFLNAIKSLECKIIDKLQEPKINDIEVLENESYFTQDKKVLLKRIMKDLTLYALPNAKEYKNLHKDLPINIYTLFTHDNNKTYFIDNIVCEKFENDENNN